MSHPPTHALADHPTLPTPAPLKMSQPGSFAHYTLTHRWPKVVQRVMTEQDFPAEIQANLEALVQEILSGTVRSLSEPELSDPGEDVIFWHRYIEPWIAQPWAEMPWFLAETYFYRRILATTQYFQSGPQQGRDPFHTQKQAGLTASLDAIAPLSAQLQDGLAGRDRAGHPDLIAVLLQNALWGNQADLSLRPDRTSAESSQFGATQGDRILVDDTASILDAMAQAAPARIDLIADNAGVELVCDLYLAHLLLMSDRAAQVHLHLKAHPTFVSDATVTDVHQTLAILAEADDPSTQNLARQIQAQIQGDRLWLRDDDFWTSPLACWQMPELLRQDFAASRLVIFKGDANYRRLLGDRAWPFTQAFSEIVNYFPTGLVALRSLKSEIVAGLSADQIETLNQQDSDWMTDGSWGLIQAAL